MPREPPRLGRGARRIAARSRATELGGHPERREHRDVDAGARAAERDPGPQRRIRIGGQLGDHRRGRGLVVPEVHADGDAVPVGVDPGRDRRARAGWRPARPTGFGAVMTQRRDQVARAEGVTPGRDAGGDARAGRVEAEVRDRGRRLRVAPVLEVATGRDVRRRARPVGAERDPVRDRRAGADRLRGPGATARLDDPAAVGVGEQERREVRLVVILLAAPALPVGRRAAR